MNEPSNIAKAEIEGESEVRSLVPYRGPASQSPIDPEWNPEEPKLGLRDYWLMVRGRKWVIMAITLLVTALSVIYVAQQPDVYEAEARIQVDLDNPAFGQGKNGGPIIINTPRDETAYLNTQLLLLKSPAFLRRVAKTLNLEQRSNAFSWDSGGRTSTWANILRFAGLGENRVRSQKEIPLRASSIAPTSDDGDMNESLTLEPYVGAIKGGLDAKVTETSRLISIDFRHSDPNSAAKVANVVADTFVQANWERRVNSTSAAGDFLKKRIDELHFKISDNEKRLIEYAKEHKIFPLDSGRDIQSDRLAALDKGLLDAENARKAAESEYQATLAPGAAAAIVDSSDKLSSIEARLADLRQRRAVLLIEAGENWPAVKELDKQIADFEAQLKDTRDRAISVVLTNLETRYKEALSREQALRKDFEQQHSDTMNQNAAAIDYRMIQAETTTYRALLDSMLQRSKENDVVLAATPNNVQVTDYATRPEVPVGPRRFQIVSLAFAASLAFGVGFAVLLGSFEDSMPVDSVDRVERLFGLPTLTVIPEVKRRRQLRGLRVLQKHNGNGNGNRNGFTGLLVRQGLGVPMIEAYRKLRTSVLLSNSDYNLKTLLVTSSLPAEGKTTASINLAYVLAQTEARVLLIDGDLRQPRLHEMLGVANEQGLSTILTGNVSEGDEASLITQHEGSNLYLLPSGPPSDDPAELLGSERMRLLLKRLNLNFSYIIIDSPPISFFTDAVLLSSLVDGVLMVVRGPKSPREVARYSLQSLDAVGAPMLGVVLNAVNVRTNNRSYYTNYYNRLSS